VLRVNAFYQTLSTVNKLLTAEINHGRLVAVIVPQKLLGDCRQTLKTLPEKSFQLCITSPPYWGLRSYLPENHPLKPLEIGSEPTLELYIEHLLESFREVWRVLRDDGTLVVNMGDAYANDTKLGGKSGAKNYTSAEDGMGGQRIKRDTGLKPKDLLMMPSRVAMALQSNGWYLRSMIPWIKRNAMPESVTDRPATATEYLFLFSKSERYYWDRYAVMMPVSANTNARVSQATLQTQMGGSKQEAYKNDPENGKFGRKSRDRTPIEILKSMAGPLGGGKKSKMPGPNSRFFRDRDAAHGDKIKNNASFTAATLSLVSARNRRNTDWFLESWQGLMLGEAGDPLALVVNPKGTTIAHFASYPPKLVEPFIKACTSEGGCCPECGAPMHRIIENGEPDREHQKLCGGDAAGQYDGQALKDFDGNGVQNASDVKRRILEGMREKKTVGWQATCDHKDFIPKPCAVLDCFGGTSTTAEVATRLGRHSTMCELNEEYFEAARIRDSQTGLALI
jgi:site-specific DNA-methyltransferase (cytosine-N4-specific)